MTVKTVYTATEAFDVTGSGYQPQGSFIVRDREFSCHLLDNGHSSCDEHPPLMTLVRGASLCNDASLSESEEKWQVDGDPTEGALLVLARKAGLWIWMNYHPLIPV